MKRPWIAVVFMVVIYAAVAVFFYWVFVPGTDLSCETDSDCEIKDVGNFCGYYPMCVNKGYEPNPPEIKSAVCGFKEIRGCKCVENECVGFYNETN